MARRNKLTRTTADDDVTLQGHLDQMNSEGWYLVTAQTTLVAGGKHAFTRFWWQRDD